MTDNEPLDSQIERLAELITAARLEVARHVREAGARGSQLMAAEMDRSDLAAENARLRQERDAYWARLEKYDGQSWDELIAERDEWKAGMHRALKDREAGPCRGRRQAGVWPARRHESG